LSITTGLPSVLPFGTNESSRRPSMRMLYAVAALPISPGQSWLTCISASTAVLPTLTFHAVMSVTA